MARTASVAFQLEDVLDIIAPGDRHNFVNQYLRDEATVVPSRPATQRALHHRSVASRLIVPQDLSRPTMTPPRQPFGVTYKIPLDKARPHTAPTYPQGSVMDPSILIRPASPTTPFEFPFEIPTPHHLPALDYNPSTYVPFDSVTRVVGLPRVCGLTGDDASFARVTRTAISMDASNNPSLMDGGANICITGILGLLIDVVLIPPIPISVATTSGSISMDDCCTKRGLIPLTLSDGSIYYQPCYYCKNAVETIISPEAIVAASDILVHWTQEGHKGSDSGSIRFTSDSGLYSITLSLEKRDGLYYCPTDAFTLGHNHHCPTIPTIKRIAAPITPTTPRRGRRYLPVSQDRMAESEVWMQRLGCPGEDQLDLLHGNVTGIPPSFQYHPFRFVDWKEEARIQKQAALRSAERTTTIKRRFYLDFGFMRASTQNFQRPNKAQDRVVLSYDGFSSYLLIVDEASRHVWVFLTKTKEPPMDIISAFLARHGHTNGGCIRTDQGGELARSSQLLDMVLRKYNYVMEPTGADSPSQNGAIEIYNNKLAIRARTLLYGSGLPAKYWSAALQHSVYLANRLVHTITKKTPFEAFYGIKPDIAHLKLFGSRVCVKRSGIRRAKLDKHDFKGIFLGYTATDQNIVYLDLDSGLVKRSHHAQFDEAWFLQDSRPPAAQLLYDLGMEPDGNSYSETDVVEPDIESDFRLPGTIEQITIPWPPTPPLMNAKSKLAIPDECAYLPLPLRHIGSARHHQTSARAARVQTPIGTPRQQRRPRSIDVMTTYDIGPTDMATIYMSPDPYFEAFEQPIDF